MRVSAEWYGLVLTSTIAPLMLGGGSGVNTKYGERGGVGALKLKFVFIVPQIFIFSHL